VEEYAMPRFYFDFRDSVVLRDPEGRELPDLDAARMAAVEEARHCASGDVCKGRLHLDHKIEVKDVGGNIVASVSVRDAVSG
jgi:hypothetical protein